MFETFGVIVLVGIPLSIIALWFWFMADDTIKAGGTAKEGFGYAFDGCLKGIFNFALLLVFLVPLVLITDSCSTEQEYPERENYRR